MSQRTNVNIGCLRRRRPTIRRIILGVIASVAASQAAAESFHDLLVVYRCEVVRRLEQIYATGNPASDRNRFIAITVPGHPHGYVQCIFHDNQPGLYCEAASGFWYDKPGA